MVGAGEVMGAKVVVLGVEGAGVVGAGVIGTGVVGGLGAGVVMKAGAVGAGVVDAGVVGAGVVMGTRMVGPCSLFLESPSIRKMPAWDQVKASDCRQAKGNECHL